MQLHNFQELLQRKLTRKEFLQVIGLMLLSVIGVGGMLRNINSSLEPKTKKPDNYSESSYGG